MRSLSNLSVQKRLSLVFRLAVCLSLAVVFIGFGLIVVFYSRSAFTQEISSVASVVGATSRAALVFNDRQAGTRVLAGLGEKKNVSYAVLKQTNGDTVAEFGFVPPIDKNLPLKDGTIYWSLTHIAVTQPVFLDGERIGSITVVSNLNSLYYQLFVLLCFALLVGAFAVFIAAYFSKVLERWVSQPIASLKDLTLQVSQTKDLSSRLETSGEDEIQQLFRSFNHMLEQLEERDDALMHAKNKAEEATRVKSMFLATVSHELRTPMHAILGMTDEVLTSEITGEQRELLDIVKSAGNALLFVINDILDFSAIEAGKLRLSPAEFSLGAFVQRLQQMFSLSAKSKGIQLNFRASSEIPDLLVADAGRLSQILVNLIGNALKFTRSGSVELLVSLRGIEKEMASLEFSVVDTGIGIDAESLRIVFDSFTKVRREGEAIEGTGLGLAITAKLVEIMGGWIWAESVPGEGSKFNFVIKCKLPQVNTAPDLHLVDPRASNQGENVGQYTILIVEDNSANRKLAERVLNRAGYKTLLAMNGKECLEVLDTTKVDLVLMDLDMPVMNGMQATEAIRSKEKGSASRLPIVAFTASAAPEDAERCLRNGMDAFLSKPVDRGTLLETLSKFLKPIGQEPTVQVLPKNES